MKKKINIYGSGITGLTICHELINNDFDIHIYEKNNNIGGMARSNRNKLGISHEHSWRAFGENYINLYNIMNRIPIYKKNKDFEQASERDSSDHITIDISTTFNNLILNNHYFKLFYNQLHEQIPKLSLFDSLYIFYLYLKFITSNKRESDFYKIK